MAPGSMYSYIHSNPCAFVHVWLGEAEKQGSVRHNELDLLKVASSQKRGQTERGQWEAQSQQGVCGCQSRVIIPLLAPDSVSSADLS